MTAATPPVVRIDASGESALRVVGRSGDPERDWRVAHHLARRLSAAEVPGLLGCIPTYESVLIEFDAMATSAEAITAVTTAELELVDADEPLLFAPKRFRVPVVYGGETGPDLDEVARITGLTVDEVVELHSATEYVVRCLGAPGGSPMLDGPAFPTPVPRLQSPRAHVPQGAVSVAGRQATITPTAAPGGWRVIGWTPFSLIDLADERLVPYEPGDLLRFEPMERDAARAFVGRRLAAEVIA